ncbi:trigger factor [uncultured Slackia sp.]|uniref:trigger factor n=1 Tax=uncultured Slackia sp. TaxID=665903 RepID=UPI0025DF28D4|nr:trigger factor [uncultured Slackia sp.]
MKTNVEVLESGATKLTVTIEAADIDRRIKKTYKDFGTKYKFPGFRPGHVPRPVIDSHLGKDAVRQQVTEEMLNEAFPLAIDECDLSPISQAKFSDVDGFVEEGKDFVFSAEFEVKPELELSDYSPVHVEIPFKTASEAEIDEQVAALADYYHDLKNANANTKVKSDSIIDINISATDDKGEEIAMLSAEERIYELGRGIFPASFDEALVGLKKGESVSVTLKTAEESGMMMSVLKDRTETVTLDATVAAVKKKVVPEVTDEWAKEKLGVESVEKLREQVATTIEQQKGDVIPRILENNALYELQKRLEGEVPASMVDEAEGDLLQSFFTQLQSQGVTLDAYLQQQGITPDKFKEDVKHQAEDTVKQNLALDAWARKNGIVVTDEEVEDEFKTSGAKEPEKMYAEWKAQGRLHIVREGILRGKALEAVLRDAEVVEVEKLSSAEEEEKPAKKTSKKKSAKKEEAPAEDAEAPAAE